MCQPNALVKENGEEKVVMQDVARLSFEDGKIVLETMFGERLDIEGEIEEINFLDSRVVIKAA